MVFHQHDHRSSAVDDLHLSPLQPVHKFQQHTPILSRYQETQFKITEYTLNWSQHRIRLALYPRYDTICESITTSTSSIAMCNTLDAEDRSKEEIVLDELLVDHGRYTDQDNDHDDILRLHQSARISMMHNTFDSGDHKFYASSFNSSDLDSGSNIDTEPSNSGDSFFGSEAAFGEPADHTHGNKFRNYAGDHQVFKIYPSLEDYTSPSPAYVPSLPVSPQDLLLDKTALAYASSPDLSTQDGYSSSDYAYSRYASEPPAYTSQPREGLMVGSLPTSEPGGRWWPHTGMFSHQQPHYQTRSAPSSFYNPGKGEMLERSQPHFGDPLPPAYPAGAPDEDQAQARKRDDQNNFLITSRFAGMSYKEIRKAGGFREAESTLRGRFRDLTKHRHERVRKPVWTRRDVQLLNDAVHRVTSGFTDKVQHTRLEFEALLSRVRWKKISSYIVDNGGSYRFGPSTCKKKYVDLCRE